MKPSEIPDLAALADQVRPKLQPLEAHRQEMRKSTLMWATVILTIPLVAGIAASIAMATIAPLLVLAFVAVILAIIFVSRRQTQWADHAGEVLIPEIAASRAGDIEYQPTGDEALVKPFNALELIGHWNRGTVKHQVCGSYRGRRFEWALASLQQQSRSSRKRDSSVTQVFYGLLFRIETRIQFEPGLSIRPNFGWFTKTFGKRAIPTGNKAFDAVFLVSVDDDRPFDSEQLNQLLTPEWQQALLAMHDDAGTLPYEQPRLRAGMKYDAFYLALTLEEEGRQMGRIRTSKTRVFPDVGRLIAKESALHDKLEPVIRDIDTFRRIIDCLPQPNRPSDP